MPTDRRPTIYLSNWSSARTPGHHGPGRKLTIMAAPRAWERGVGRVSTLTPVLSDLRNAQKGRLSPEEYRRRFELDLRRAMPDAMSPGALLIDAEADDWEGIGGHPSRVVRDGDTLCCACSRDAAAAGRCHRVWAAPALVRAGWRVILDGVEVPDAG